MLWRTGPVRHFSNNSHDIFFGEFAKGNRRSCGFRRDASIERTAPARRSQIGISNLRDATQFLSHNPGDRANRPFDTGIVLNGLSVQPDNNSLGGFHRNDFGRMSLSRRIHGHHSVAGMKCERISRASDKSPCAREANYKTKVRSNVLTAIPSRRNPKQDEPGRRRRRHPKSDTPEPSEPLNRRGIERGVAQFGQILIRA